MSYMHLPAEFPLTAEAIHGEHGMRAKFRQRNHHPSPEQWVALEALVQTLERMSNGTASNSLFLSAEDPGLGKTTAISCFVDALLTHRWEKAGVLICLGRHEEMDNMIEALVKDAAVPRNCIATRAGKGYFNADAQAPSIDQAQILVATQQGLAKLAKYKSFSETTAFHYRGKPRTIRVWDESFQQGDPLALDRDDIVSLAKLFRYGPLKPLGDRLEQLFLDLKDAPVDTPFPMPDFEGDFDMPIETLLGNLKSNLGETRSRHLEALWTMSGRLVGVHKDSSGGTAVDYEETAPADLAPMLVCDASGRVRESYKSMEKDRGNWVRLPHAGKLYDNLTIHHWNKGGGKASFATKPTPSPNRPLLIEGIAKTLDTKPDERWLVVHHMQSDRIGDIKGDVEKLLKETPKENISWLHYGTHMATNAHRDIENIIIAGLHSYSDGAYEAHKRLASGRRAADGPVTKEEFDATKLGEHKHHILQAACRSAVRKSRGAGCHPANLYLIAPKNSGVPDILTTDIFPGATLVDWQPVPKELKGHVKAAFEVVRKWAGNSTANPLLAPLGENECYLQFSTVARAIGLTSANFKDRVRSHPEFIKAIARMGVVEAGGQRMTRFWKPFEAA